MTPTQIEDAARRKYNSVGDSFWSSDEILGLLYEACLELAVECELIEAKDATTSTVASTKAYSFPTRFIAIKRMEYNGQKLFKISDRDADAINLFNSAVTPSGTPQHYWVWNEQFYLEPTPDGVGTLTVYGYKEPAAITAQSTLEIPSLFHFDCVNYIVSEMCAKDENLSTAQYYMGKWMAAKAKAKRWKQKRKRTDSFAHVIDEGSTPVSLIGGG